MPTGSQTSSYRNDTKKSSNGAFSFRLLRVLAGNPFLIQNLLRAEYRRKLGVRLDRRTHPARSGMPVTIGINLTRRCNLKCAMCNQHRHSSGTTENLDWYDPDKELPLSVWVGLLEQVKSFQPTLYVTGGEPTLYPHFPVFVKEAKKRRFLVQMSTNGTTLSHHAEMLVNEGVEIVMVSLDGPNKVHDAIRGQERLFSRTVDGIATLLDLRGRRRSPGPVVGINFTISKENFGFIPEMVPLVHDLGADFLQFQHTIFSSREHTDTHNRIFSQGFADRRGIRLISPSIPEGEFYENQISADDVARIVENLKLATDQARGRLKISFLPNIPLNMLHHYYLDLNYPFPGPCHSLWKTLRVLPDGTVSPCLHVVAGNIRDQSVKELWNSATMRNFREVIADRLLPGCARCCSRSFV